MPAPKRTHKDSVFRLLFNQPDILRSLYNALKGTNYGPEVPVTLATLSTALFAGLANDIAFFIDGRLVVILEHQSTLNPNMPLRCLFYLSRIYESVIDSRSIYKNLLLKIAEPVFIVLYNGTEETRDYFTLKLSDAYKQVTGKTPSLELTVEVYNINAGHNEEILKKCVELDGYARFVGEVRRRQGAGEDLEAAIRGAIEACVDAGILVTFLRRHGSEVKNMLTEEWDLEEAKKVWAEEARELADEARAEGRSEGIVEGRSEGLAEGIAVGGPREALHVLDLLASGKSPEEIRQMYEGRLP